jgi:hypothetical protein
VVVVGIREIAKDLLSISSAMLLESVTTAGPDSLGMTTAGIKDI